MLLRNDIDDEHGNSDCSVKKKKSRKSFRVFVSFIAKYMLRVSLDFFKDLYQIVGRTIGWSTTVSDVHINRLKRRHKFQNALIHI